jgi:hypothetical protein
MNAVVTVRREVPNTLPPVFVYCGWCKKRVLDHKPGEYDRHLIFLAQEIAGIEVRV